MKKVTLIFATISIMIFASCNDKKEVTEETVIIETEAAAPAVEEEGDGTSLSINNDGVEFSTKDGDNKVEVEIDDKKK
ncbi:hypothetical protein [Flavobacterium sp.]|jgi:hypothetical protein|uniref:hypothetical protein n=1 Tax=Flavobacterium sp. TaxID=239 RepID=UPI002A815201|nr:hypothetical protein [Flavobacterium sp.]